MWAVMRVRDGAMEWIPNLSYERAMSLRERSNQHGYVIVAVVRDRGYDGNE